MQEKCAKNTFNVFNVYVQFSNAVVKPFGTIISSMMQFEDKK